ncbi:MAG: VWA domain-containing protein [Spirochaetaceae bacterium]|jgi:uncharacterized protein YegL|nr:VWA domain-containing protein [Spirochaetaceae bacterium]
MADKPVFGKSDFANNPTARLPVCLCLDTSGSMSGDPIRELNSGISTLYEVIERNIKTKLSAEISIVTFGGQAQIVEDFETLDQRPEPPELYADGLTPMGEAVNLALDILEERKRMYKDAGIDYFQPWLVLITDGQPEGHNPEELERAIKRTCSLITEKKLTLFPIGVEGANLDVLSRFSPNRPPLKLQGLKFDEFFEWLGKSIERTSVSIPGEKVPLDQDGIKGWAEI